MGKPMNKAELLQSLREQLLRMQGLRAYGPLGCGALIMCFAAYLMCCLPGTIVVDMALGNIYGAVLGTLVSVCAKTASALLAIPLGRCFGKALGLELPERLRERLGPLRTHPLK